ncbi:MAG TPA: hotdog domain-containing protein [Acidimicrobiales bacterium]|nr:hotdog domain-containing protein [Acidimicrobiales bacterium]
MTEPIDPWQNRAVDHPLGSEAFGQLVVAMRDVQDLLASTDPPEEVVVAARDTLRELADRLAPWVAEERRAPAGKRPDDPGRAHPFLPPFVPEERTDTVLRGRVRFGRFYLGGNGAAHGGAIPLLFDEVLGVFQNGAGRPVARTAYLHVNYRAITPIETDLTVEATLEREEGRKRWATGRLLHGDRVVADAEGLFVQLLPGQP